jgi:hypothetical protein
MESTVTTANSVDKTWEAAMSQWSKLWEINDVVFIMSDALTFFLDFSSLRFFKI